MKLNNIFGGLILGAALLSGGCVSTGTFSETELRTREIAEPATMSVNFVTLAEYWDKHGERYFIDLAPASSLQIDRENGIATIQYRKPGGPIWGQLELRRIEDRRTEIRSFAVKGSEAKILKWREQIIEGDIFPAMPAYDSETARARREAAELEKEKVERDRMLQPLFAANPGWTAEIRNAIRDRQILVGMTMAAVEAAWGRPARKNISGGVGDTYETWYYDRGGFRTDALTFVNGRLARWNLDR